MGNDIDKSISVYAYFLKTDQETDIPFGNQEFIRVTYEGDEILVAPYKELCSIEDNDRFRNWASKKYCQKGGAYSKLICNFTVTKEDLHELEKVLDMYQLVLESGFYCHSQDVEELLEIQRHIERWKSVVEQGVTLLIAGEV